MRAGDGYPGQPAYQPTAGLVRPSARPATPASPAQRPGVPGAPGGQPPGPGRRPKRPVPTWWIAPLRGRRAGRPAGLRRLAADRAAPPGRAPPAAASSPAASAPSGPIPAQMFPDALFKRLTTDIQGNNEKDFLSLVAPGAKPAVQTWWGNMRAIGFTTGLIMPTDKTDQVDLNAKGDGSTVVLAGTHNALDPVHNGKDDVPLERYQVGLHFSSAKAIGQVTAWKPLGDDPLDQGGKLYVRTGTNVVVAAGGRQRRGRRDPAHRAGRGRLRRRRHRSRALQ